MINKNFERIDAWLNANAEKIAKISLQKPAQEEQVQKLESAIGKTLPHDFKQLYFWHNGLSDAENFGSLFFGIDFFPLDKIISEYNDRKKMAANETVALKNADKEIDTTCVFNPDWLKFGFDGSHTGLYLDLSPTQEGKYGQIIFIDDEYEMGILVANSTNELVSDFVHDLENNLYFLNTEALEDGNHYLEADTKIDLVNWPKSEKWKR